MWVRKLLFGFDGRVGRTAYWLVLLAVMLIDSAAFGAVGGFELFDGDSLTVARKSASRFLPLLVGLPSLWDGPVLRGKRRRDRHKSGRGDLLTLVPDVGWLS